MDRKDEMLIHARYALELAIELQESVENYRPDGYGSPINTLVWMDVARAVVNEIDRNHVISKD